jgi:hypothetical protein
MVLLSTWSRRKKEAARAASGVADVYRYERPSGRLREQIRQLVSETSDRMGKVTASSIYEGAVTVMRKELGRSTLHNAYSRNLEEEFDWFIINASDIDDFLTFLEIATRLIIYYANQGGRAEWAQSYVEELNAWMLEDGFGFQIQDRDIVQISSQFAHAEVVVPALELLGESRFAGANVEFRQAHAEFRAGEYEDCIHDCCNAFESVLKVILDGKGWAYQPTDTAKKLLDVAFANDLIPAHMQNAFTGLRTILESGVPTVRNRNAGHGTGANPRNIPKYVAAFQLHQTAAAILLLVESAK